MLNRTIVILHLELYCSRMLKKKILNLFPTVFISPTSILFSLFLLFSVSPSLLSPLYGPNAISSLSSFSSCGFWLCPELKRGCGLWVVGRRCCGSVVVVDRRGCGLWVVDRRGWVVVVDRRAGMKGVVGRGSAAEGGRWSWING